LDFTKSHLYDVFWYRLKDVFLKTSFERLLDMHVVWEYANLQLNFGNLKIWLPRKGILPTKTLETTNLSHPTRNPF